MAVDSSVLPKSLSSWKNPLEEVVSRRLANIEPNSLGEAIRCACKGGKRIRPLISLWFGAAHGVDRDSSLGVACLTEWLHNAFLIHDDIQDGDAWRRDEPTLWKSHGTATALNAADWLLSAVYSEISRLSVDDLVRSRLLQAVSDVHRRTVEGQQLDLGGRADSRFQLSDYERLVKSKTGRYLALGMVCAAILAGFDDDRVNLLWRVGDQLGPAFQIQDDLLDLTPEKGRGGEFGNDIREGKPSILFAHSIQSGGLNQEERERLVEIMALPREETSASEVEECIGLFDKTGSIDFAREEAKSRSRTGLELFASIQGVSSEVLQEFEMICNYMTDRSR
ncbi:MAG: polyprenyl synthetase family protein [Planctomycetota bacterium]